MKQLQLEETLAYLIALLSVDSPTGFTKQAAEFVRDQLADMGISASITAKGGVMADLGPFCGEGAPILLSAHIDTLGAMVREIKSTGRLKVINIGGLNASNTETEAVRVYTRDGRSYEGTLQLSNASIHVNGDFASTVRTWDNVEVVLDENVKSAEDVKKLGIENGCFVCVEPRTVITETGYIKSRYLDDKLSAAIFLELARCIKDGDIRPKRHVYLHFTVYEEVGHGACGVLPEGVEEMLGVDMGCVGDGLLCTERDVSICAADSSGPYNYEMVSALVSAAKKHSLSYAVDVYPHYGSDCSAAVREYNIRHALIGAGVYASHGYERSHTDGLRNTFDLLCAYLCD